MSQSAGTVPLLYVSMLFLGCHHFFSMERNRRSFCWTVEDAALLLSAIKECAQTDEILELGSITLTNTETHNLTDHQKNIIKREPNMVYDVHDGQNRLLCLCLLLAALRDMYGFLSTKNEAGTIVLILPENDTKTMVERIDSVTKLFAPQPGRGPREPRIRLSESERPRFERLLLEVNPIQEETDDPPKQRARVEHSATTDKMTQIHSFFIKELQKMVTGNTNLSTGRVYYDISTLIYLHDTIENQVRFIVFKISEERIALNLVMNQPLGKPVELVDHFKFLLCRNNGDSDPTHVQENNVKKWDTLCSKTSRETIKVTCLYLARITSGTELQLDDHNFNRAIDFFKKYVEAELSAHGMSGSLVISLFESAVWKLYHFRMEKYTKLYSSILDEEETAISSSYQFLNSITKMSRGKQLEVAVFDVLKRHEDFHELKHKLLLLESIGLWMVTCKPSFAMRQTRVLQILAELRGQQLTEGGGIELSTIEKANMHQALEVYSLTTSSDKPFVKAVLLRLNLHKLQNQNKTLLVATTAGNVFLESIISTTEESHDVATAGAAEADQSPRWMPSCLGNFVVTLVRPRPRNSSEEEKRQRFQQCPLPITDDVAKLEEWSKDTLVAVKQDIVNSAVSLWLGNQTQSTVM